MLILLHTRKGGCKLKREHKKRGTHPPIPSLPSSQLPYPPPKNRRELSHAPPFKDLFLERNHRGLFLWGGEEREKKIVEGMGRGRFPQRPNRVSLQRSKRPPKTNRLPIIKGPLKLLKLMRKPSLQQTVKNFESQYQYKRSMH